MGHTWRLDKDQSNSNKNECKFQEHVFSNCNDLQIWFSNYVILFNELILTLVVHANLT